MSAAKILLICLLAGFGWFESKVVAQQKQPVLKQPVLKQPVDFQPETIDSQVIIGYGTAIGDVDGGRSAGYFTG